MFIAGIDEVGRGPLAGPVVASAVILDPRDAIGDLIDSKKLAPLKRKKLSAHIQKAALAFAIGQASVAEIDQYNILNASLLAMKRAADALSLMPDQVFIDGKHSPILSIPTQTIIKGDEICPSISAASIVAKVFRDELMQQLHHQYPEYSFAQHKGYGTSQHIAALTKYGYTPLHRYSFAPVRQCIKNPNYFDLQACE